MPRPRGSAESRFEPHPILSRLLEQSEGAGARAFRGYIGPSKAEGGVWLYPSLGDLSFSIEIREADILDTADAPETLLPHGGTIVWVRTDAEVVFHGREVTTVAVRSIGLGPRQEAIDVARTSGAFVDVQQGRLRLRVRSRVMDTCASCSCSSCEPHPGCTSTCKSTLPPVVVGPGQ